MYRISRAVNMRVVQILGLLASIAGLITFLTPFNRMSEIVSGSAPIPVAPRATIPSNRPETVKNVLLLLDRVSPRDGEIVRKLRSVNFAYGPVIGTSIFGDVTVNPGLFEQLPSKDAQKKLALHLVFLARCMYVEDPGISFSKTMTLLSRMNVRKALVRDIELSLARSYNLYCNAWPDGWSEQKVKNFPQGDVSPSTGG